MLKSPGHRRVREGKKCRKVYGLEQRDLWCTQCKWKKACARFGKPNLAPNSNSETSTSLLIPASQQPQGAAVRAIKFWRKISRKICNKFWALNVQQVWKLCYCLILLKVNYMSVTASLTDFSKRLFFLKKQKCISFFPKKTLLQYFQRLGASSAHMEMFASDLSLCVPKNWNKKMSLVLVNFYCEVQLTDLFLIHPVFWKQFSFIHPVLKQFGRTLVIFWAKFWAKMLKKNPRLTTPKSQRF